MLVDHHNDDSVLCDGMNGLGGMSGGATGGGSGGSGGGGGYNENRGYHGTDDDDDVDVDVMGGGSNEDDQEERGSPSLPPHQLQPPQQPERLHRHDSGGSDISFLSNTPR